MTGDSHKWRFRELLAMQLPVLCGLFSPVATYSVVSKMLFELLFDPVKTVQAHAFEVGARVRAGMRVRVRAGMRMRVRAGISPAYIVVE